MVEGVLPGFGPGWFDSVMGEAGGVWGRLGEVVAGGLEAGDMVGRRGTLRRLMAEQGFTGVGGAG